jgi:hypothetical protein
VKAVLNSNALVTDKRDGVQCVWNRMCVKIPYTNDWHSVLIVPLTSVHDYYFLL